MEGPPEQPKAPASEPLDQDIVGAPEQFERITDDEAREAYQSGNTERFGVWVRQQQERAAEDPTGMGHFYLEVRLVNIQVAAGEKEAAAERLQETYSNVWQELRDARTKSPVADKDAELARLKHLQDLETTKAGLRIRFQQLTGLELEDE